MPLVQIHVFEDELSQEQSTDLINEITDEIGSAAQPADVARVAEYGAVGEIPAAMFNQFMSMFESTDSPNPHDVAEAILRLIDAPIAPYCAAQPADVERVAQ